MCLRANTIYPGNIEKKSALSRSTLSRAIPRGQLPLWSVAGREKPHLTEFRSRKKSAIGLIEEEEKEEEKEGEEGNSKGAQKEDDRDDRERNGNAREIAFEFLEDWKKENFFSLKVSNVYLLFEIWIPSNPVWLRLG